MYMVWSDKKIIELYAVDLALKCIPPILLSILDIQNAVAAVFDCREIKGKRGVKFCYWESVKQNYHKKEKWVGWPMMAMGYGLYWEFHIWWLMPFILVLVTVGTNY